MPNGPLALYRSRRGTGTLKADAAQEYAAERLQSLFQALRNPRVLAFLAVWFGINIVFGIGAIAVGSAEQSVAWQAHIGGFLAGLLLFSLFDPVSRRSEDPSPLPPAEPPPADVPDGRI